MSLTEIIFELRSGQKLSLKNNEGQSFKNHIARVIVPVHCTPHSKIHPPIKLHVHSFSIMFWTKVKPEKTEGVITQKL